MLTIDSCFNDLLIMKTKSGKYALSILFAFCFQNLFSQTSSIEWENSFGGSANEFAYSISQIRKDAFLVAGYAQSADGQVRKIKGLDDYWVMVIDEHGNARIAKTLGGSKRDEAFSAAATNDSGYIVAGYSFSNDGDITNHHGSINNEDYWVVKLNGRGED